MSTTQAPTLGFVLQQAAEDPIADRHLRRLALRLLWPLAAAVAFGLAWSAIAPLSGAVVAPAEVKVDCCEAEKATGKPAEAKTEDAKKTEKPAPAKEPAKKADPEKKVG